MTGSDVAPPRTEWKPIHGARHYEASHQGLVRSVDRTIGGKFYPGVVLKTRVNNSGYEMVNIRTNDGQVKTCTVHSLVLLAHVGPRPEGMETLHGPGGPLDNRLVNLTYGTKKQNEAQKEGAGAPPVPQFDCLNHPACTGKAHNAGRRCPDCVDEVGRQAAAMLNARVNLNDVAARFGYTGIDWVYGLAVKHGYEGSRAQARTQQPPWSRRVTATLRARFRRGDAA